jgi:DNA-binding NtrC family response regulator
MRHLVARYRDQVRQFKVPGQAVQLGSAEANDFVVPFRGVSRYHAVLTPVPEGVLLTDLGSTNGLVRDGKRLGEILLLPGEAIQLGHALLTLEEVLSSDGETGLRLDAGKNPSSPRHPGSDTPLAIASGGPASPAAALHFVRDLERMLRSGGVPWSVEVLGRARAVLGADVLLVIDAVAGSGPDAGLLACAGTFPVADVLEELIARSRSEMEPNVALVLAGGAVAALAAPGARPQQLLAALFDSRRQRLDSWQCDLLTFLGETLLGEGGRHAPVRPPAAELELRVPADMVVGGSPAMQQLLARLRAMVRSDLPVLLSGETGTGKELFAHLIHDSGPGGGGPFIAVNCAAIPAELLEAELFGVAARVATGVDPRPGLVVQAHGGTLFLDEIGDLPLPLQAKLLRVLQQREVLPLGGSQPKKVAARVIAASNRDLAVMREQRLFRDDLYYRLCGLHLRIPPLRERREDLPELILAFAERAAAKYSMRIRGVSRRALATLLGHPWPGNVRQLEHALEQAVLLCPDGGLLQAEHFANLEPTGGDAAPEEAAIESSTPARTPPATSGSVPPTLSMQVDDLERRAIAEALRLADGNRSRAAKLLDITRNGLASKMRRLGLAAHRTKRPSITAK